MRDRIESLGCRDLDFPRIAGYNSALGARSESRAQPTPSIHNTEPITMDDAIIIGGSFAGLAAALQLGRARRKVTVLDTEIGRAHV